MRRQHILGLSSAAFSLLISISACDKVNIPGHAAGKLSTPMQSLSNTSISVPPTLVAKLGNRLYNWEVGRKEKEMTPEVTEQMTRIFDLLKAAALADQTYGPVAKEMDWQLYTVKENIAMAKAFPGGGIVIYDGVFPIAKSEDALAAILGHEMAHVLARHEVKRLTGPVAVAAATLGPAIASGTNPDKLDPSVIGPVAGALGVGYTIGVRQPWQQAQELEADCLGLKLAAKAGYDPIKIAGFWRRMAEAAKTEGANDTYQFLNDHPIDDDRVAHIKNTCLPSAQEIYSGIESAKRQNVSASLPNVVDNLDSPKSGGIVFPMPLDPPRPK